MQNLTIPEIEALVCFFQDYLEYRIHPREYQDNNENKALDTAIEKFKDELR